MFILRLGVLIMAVLFGSIGVFLGGVVGYASLRSGEISYSMTSAGAPRSVTVRRETDPNGFWMTFALISLVPLLVGGTAAWYGWTRLRQ